MTTFSIQSLPKPPATRKITHPGQVHNIDTRHCTRAPIMVIPGICPHCGGVARIEHAAYSTDYLVCLYCGWREERRRPSPVRVQLPRRYSREARNASL